MQYIPIHSLQNIISEIKTKLLKVFLTLDRELELLIIWILISVRKKTELSEINTTVNNYIYNDNCIHVGDKNKIDGTSFST